MTDATATFHDVKSFDDRRLSSLGKCRKALRRLVQAGFIGLGSVAAAGAAIATVFVAAAWLANITLTTRPTLQSHASIGRTAVYPNRRHAEIAAADITGSIPVSISTADMFEPKWARTTPDRFTPRDRDVSQRQAARLTDAPPPPLGNASTPASDDMAPARGSRVAALPAAEPPVLPPAAPRSSPVASDHADLPPLPRPHPLKENRSPDDQAASPIATTAPPTAATPANRPLQRFAHNKAPALPEREGRTAIYDITAQTVYMPNGERLEAHSGLGNRLDDPRYTRVKNKGPTPPNTYKLTLRERLFHGVQAVRLNPVDESKMFGRDGMLAHTYLLGPSGESNGCVSFKDYPKFLQAFLNGEVDRLVVVASLEDTSPLIADARRRSVRRYADNNYSGSDANLW